MESIYLRTLVEVARTGSVTRAAEALAVTQSAASRRIRLLEEHYGTALLDRSSPTLALTPAGALVVEKAQRILEVERELAAALRGMAEKAPALSFACTPTFGAVHLPQILREFVRGRAGLGDLRVALQPAERIVEGLRDGRYETAVIEHCQCIDLGEAEKVSLAGDEMVFAAAPGLGLGGPLVPLDRLLACTLYSLSEGCCGRVLRLSLEKLGRSPADFARLVVYDDPHAILDAVSRGEGVAFASTDLLRPAVEAGRIAEHRVPGFQHARDRTLVRNGAGGGHAAALVREIVARVGRGVPSLRCA